MASPELFGANARRAAPGGPALAFGCGTRDPLPKHRARRPPVNDVSAPETKGYKWVGTRPIRPDGVPKVTGTAMYGSDMAMPGMLTGRILRSPHAHARIKSIDTSKAAALPGVKAVVTSADFPEIKSEEAFVGEGPMNFRDLSYNCMARGKVLYDGHAVAAVAATSPAIAEEALDLIDVQYEVLPHVIDVEDAMKDG